MQSAPTTNRAATPWAMTAAPDWLGPTAMAVLRCLRRLSGFGTVTPELHMSPEWLEDYARWSRAHPDDP